MSTIRYTNNHEWIRSEDDGTMTVGITDYAQQQLGDIVFVELPEIGRHVGAGDPVVVVESVKAAADVYMPLSGEVVAVNEALADAPETVNQDPMQNGWMLRMSADDGADMDSLLDQAAYERLTGA